MKPNYLLLEPDYFVKLHWIVELSTTGVQVSLGIQACQHQQFMHSEQMQLNTLPPQNEIPAMLRVRSIGMDIFK